MVSYYHWLRGQSFAHPAVALAKAQGFSAFLNHPDTQAAFAAWPYGAHVTDARGQERATLFARLEHLDESDAHSQRQHGGQGVGGLARRDSGLVPAQRRPGQQRQQHQAGGQHEARHQRPEVDAGIDQGPGHGAGKGRTIDDDGR